MADPIDLRSLFSSGAFTRQQVEILQRLISILRGSGTTFSGNLPVFLFDGSDDGESMPIPGPRGQNGTAGATGATGPMGLPVFLISEPLDPEPGPPGAQGNPGAAGSAGASGVAGAALFLINDPLDPEPIIVPGPQGAQGNAGSAGAQGQAGAPIFLLDEAQDGDPGPPGARGDVGATGNTGLQGQAGAALFLANEPLDPEPGPPGAQGNQGNPGADGLPGAQGQLGAALFALFDPQDGEQGNPGAAGAAGAAGANGNQIILSAAGPPSDPDPTYPKGTVWINYTTWELYDHFNDGSAFGTWTFRGLIQGSAGPTGPQGSALYFLDNIIDGADGLPGVAGNPGAAGATGAQGALGAALFLINDPLDPEPGPPGAQGNAGAAGSAGAQGAIGAALFLANDPLDPEPSLPGPRGQDGTNGSVGSNGSNGAALFMLCDPNDAGEPSPTPSYNAAWMPYYVSAIFSLGDIDVDRGAAAGGVFIRANSGVARDLRWYSGASLRWIARCDGVAESGSNVGSDWQLTCRTDAGAGLFTCISIVRSTGAMTVRDLSDIQGDVRNIPVSNKTAAYTLAATDKGLCIRKSNSTVFSVTLPLNATVPLPVGFACTLTNSGAQTLNLTVARAAGVALWRNGTNADITLTPGSSVTVLKTDTDEWSA